MKILKDFFPGGNHLLPQKNAVKNALYNKFTLISGGPGTGKTFVIGIIKTVLPLLSKKKGQPIQRIVCVASTGKAASKMEEGSTIHSALRPLVHGPGFYFNQKNPLNADILIVDEASMIDLPLLVRLLEAVPLETNIIMTGDKHQLTSIQAGAVFSDLCAVDELYTHTFTLDYNFRSQGKTGIEKLSKAINEKNIQDFESLLLSHDYPDLVFENYHDAKSVMTTLQNHITEGYGPFGNAKNEEEALSKIDDFRVLCAHNKGEYGTLQINHICEKILRSLNNSGIEEKSFIKAIMVNTNDYKKGLFNGDTGVAVEKNGDITAFFKGPDNKLKRYRYSDLPSNDTAFAITIHKSQGLTFEKVIIDARAAFAFGQVYVALSRCRTFEGIVLSTPLNTDCIKTDRTIEGFSENARNNQPTVNDLVLQRKKYEQELVFDLFDFTFLQKNFYYVFKQIRENHTTLHISFIDVFARMEGALNKEIIDVSAKFRMQLREIFMSSDSPEKEDHLQERVKKAAAYFEDKIKTIILQPVFENEVESDNKAIRTQIKKNLEQYYFDATVKYRCLEVCKSGFIIKLYLNTRAKAFIENINPLASKAKAPKSYASEREVNKPAAYSVLKAWRDDKADIADVPHYNILSQKVLLQLAVDLPVSKNEFLAIKGFGKHKYAAFGDELTEIILPYRIEKNPGFQRMNVAENDDYDLKVEEKSKKQPVGFSQLKSLELFNEGKSIPEIAAERQMVVSTIEGHLAGFIATGELEIHKFMETEKVSRLSDFIIQNPVKMNEVKAHFKDEFSYSEIRFVIKHLEFLGKKETRH